MKQLNKPILTALTFSAALAAGGVAAQTGATGNNVSGNATNATSNAAQAQMNQPSPAQARINESRPAEVRANEANRNNPGMAGTTGENTANPTGATPALLNALPETPAAYTYYPDANVYRSTSDNRYYFEQNGRWVSSATAPKGVKLGTQTQTVRLKGTGTADRSM